mmetsp:Transcript_15104/g.37820  ORF Transcript_15104/g.37820 Transcript_15104/m.37820 type:complete len:232 (-) Transcript_15104:335-1030(-)
MLRMLSPLRESTFRQKEMSFLKARKSKTEWRIETAAVRPRSQGLLSRKMRFISSWSLSLEVPIFLCCCIDWSHCITISHLRRSLTVKESFRGSSVRVPLTGSILWFISQNSFMWTMGQYLPVSGQMSMWSNICCGTPLRGKTLCSKTRWTDSSGFHIGTISSSCSSVTLSFAFSARMSLSFCDISPLSRFCVLLALGRLRCAIRLKTPCCTSSPPMSYCGWLADEPRWRVK